MRLPFFGRRDDKPEQKTKTAMRNRIKEISESIDRRQKEAAEKVDRMIERAKAQGAA